MSITFQQFKDKYFTDEVEGNKGCNFVIALGEVGEIAPFFIADVDANSEEQFNMTAGLFLRRAIAQLKGGDKGDCNITNEPTEVV